MGRTISDATLSLESQSAVNARVSWENVWNFGLGRGNGVKWSKWPNGLNLTQTVKGGKQFKLICLLRIYQYKNRE